MAIERVRMNFHRKKRPPLEINLTPMIDVVFLLLIFFMVTTTFTRETGLNINLPEATGKSIPPPKNNQAVTLLIDAEGGYFISTNNEVKGKYVNLKVTTLKKELQLVMGNHPEIPFVISADGKTAHQAVINALDVASRVGFKHIAFATKEPETD